MDCGVVFSWHRSGDGFLVTGDGIAQDFVAS